MTSRERVLTSMAHREPDRVPIDLSGHRSSGISAIAYARLRRHLGLKDRPIRVYDPIQQLAIVHDDVLDLFGVDTIELGRAFAQDDASWADWVLPDGTPCQMPAWTNPEREGKGWVMRSARGNVIARMPGSALYFEQTCFPFAEKADLDAIPEAMKECMWTALRTPSGPLAAGPGGRDLLSEAAKAFRASTDKAILGLFGGNLLEIGQFLYRNDNFFMLLASAPRQAHAFLDRLVEMHLKNLAQFLGSVGQCIDIIVFGDDLGMHSGPQISPKMYREFFKPRHERLWKRAKELSDVKVMLHCCGSVRELLPDLIEAGLDAMNPVQISAAGMEAAGLKREFGKDIVFWGGGVDTQKTLPFGTPEEVYREVRERIDIFAPGGGFVFNSTHNVQSNVPTENILAMFRAVKDSIKS